MSEQQMPARIWASNSWTFSSDPRPPYNTPYFRADIAERMAEALHNTVATIDAIYAWVERIEKQGGAKSISGVSACHAMLTSLRKNADRTNALVIDPARSALSAFKDSAQDRGAS